MYTAAAAKSSGAGKAGGVGVGVGGYVNDLKARTQNLNKIFLQEIMHTHNATHQIASVLVISIELSLLVIHFERTERGCSW